MTVLFIVLYLKFGLTLNFARFLFFFALLIVVSFIDIDYHAIPAHLCFIGVVGGLLFSLRDTLPISSHSWLNWQSMPVYTALRALIFGLGFSYLFKFFGDMLLSFYLHLRKVKSIEGETEALGLGDVDFMGMVGVFLGIKGALLTFFIAPFVAAVYAVFAVIFKKSHLIPYLPYLSAGALIAFFWGEKILKTIL